MTDITPQDLKAKIEEAQMPFELIDVRDAASFQEKHIPRSVNVPLVEGFVAAVGTVFHGGKDLALVLYSEHEEMGEASKACQELEAAGYTNVMHLVGGLMGWMEAGGAVEFGESS